MRIRDGKSSDPFIPDPQDCKKIVESNFWVEPGGWLRRNREMVGVGEAAGTPAAAALATLQQHVHVL